MREAVYTSRFKKDVKLSKKRGKDMERLKAVMVLLANAEPLPQELKDHPLSGNWQARRELHVEPDWLLIYKLTDDDSTITFERTGTHSDLFGSVRR
ncbi:type II toxin-antitoxin system YafQ family toxin [Candidatus Thiothrix sp. Deng01]|uniref:Type II toxin-antitoxin system YafQ family toxin n=1 Tax=Candidatus Thiothrix phosphatis TaxID=3112415 RepID=A0ABU6CTI0_9GAMM|nr:type II toxin-antitoxin system YafQ family toxin [Candidatus Thiothrix sp. Deng01]MEB4590130.1 type II toxin-antitoxin system YafQ family toxin [Candidatus Thiothrix sp. Deng01]